MDYSGVAAGIASWADRQADVAYVQGYTDAMEDAFNQLIEGIDSGDSPNEIANRFWEKAKRMRIEEAMK